MYQRLLAFLAVVGNYYRWFLDSPIKDTMPIFTEWLIPEALGLHTEVWIRAAQDLEGGGTGFHRRLKLDLGVAEKEPQNWELVRIELVWRVPAGFLLDPWQMERSGPVVVKNGQADVWVEWNTDDLKQQRIDLEAPVYNRAKSKEFTLKAHLFVKKHDYMLRTWNTTVTVEELLVRYQMPEADRQTGSNVAVLEFPKPRIRLVSVDPSRRPPAMALQTQAAELKITVPVGVYHPWIAWITIGSVSVCSLFLLLSLL